MKKVLISAIIVISFFGYFSFLLLRRFTSNQITSVVPSDIGVSRAGTLQQSITPTTMTKQNSLYTDGIYTGVAADAIYGNVQIRITVASGRVTAVDFLQYPNDQETSTSINQNATPLLVQEAIQAQSANVDIISGATLTSQAFIQSLRSALLQAKHSER